MKSEDLHISKSLKRGLEHRMLHKAPDNLMDNVMNRLAQKPETATVQIRGYQNIFILGLFISALALAWLFIPEVRSFIAGLLESRPSLDNQGFKMFPEIPMVFWWSAMSIASLFYFDFLVGMFGSRKHSHS